VLHAPLFHPAMKNVAPIRKELGVKTFFNMLGPMVNPAFPKNQLVGVFDLELVRMYGYLYQKSEKNYAVLHAMDGYDEISLTGPVKVISKNSENILTAENFGVKQIEESEIFGGETVKDSVEIFLNILNGKGTEAQKNVVCANAGMAISVVENCTIKDGFEKAKESLQSGKALNSLKKLQQLSK
jgi:anthranilate phosphoribosyltransferase